MFFANGITAVDLVINILRYLIPTFLLPIGTAILIMILDKRKLKPMLKGLLCYPLFLGSWILINIKALVKPNTTWEKIEHVRSIKINDMAKIEEHI